MFSGLAYLHGFLLLVRRLADSSIIEPTWQMPENTSMTETIRVIFKVTPRKPEKIYYPVLPNPPAPRSLAEKSSTTLNATCSTGTTTN